MNPHFLDRLNAFAAADVRFLVTGVTFPEAWTERLRRRFGPIDVDDIGRDAFIRNKKATGRPRDLVDIESFE